jgi:predicted metallopeptidase
MATTWVPMPNLKEVVEKIQAAFPDKFTHVNPDRILYAAFSRKSSKVKGRIGPIPARFSPFLQSCDYFLEVYHEGWQDADEATRLYIVLHELTHVPIEGFDKESKYYKKTLDHDLEDFRELVKQYGVDLEKADALVKLVHKNGDNS